MCIVIYDFIHAWSNHECSYFYSLPRPFYKGFGRFLYKWQSLQAAYIVWPQPPIYLISTESLDTPPMNSLPSHTTAPKKALSLPRRIALGMAVLVFAVILAFALGPRNSFGPDLPTPRAAPPAQLDQLDGWLKQTEAVYADLKPETAKSIVWASAQKQRTPWAIVYVHGFGASHLETDPVATMIAKQLGANLFQTRLSGHGRSGAAMAEPTAQDWLADVMEAARIGRTLGDRVLLIGCSTGATLGTWLGAGPNAGLVDAYAFISPNFGPRDKKSEVLNWPWGQQIGAATMGDTFSWTRPYKRLELIWTTSHPSSALYPMMALVKHVRDMDLSAFQAPVVMLYSERDEVIDPAEVKKAFARLASSAKTLEPVTYSTALTQHVLAGDATAPESSKQLAQFLINWVKSLPV
jgi:alpha-beta hydrolase superfamily lysophospholipase